MDLLDHRGRALRLLVAVVIGAATGVGLVFGFGEILEPDYSGAPAWFAVFMWTATFLLVTIGVNAVLAARAKRRWHLPFPTARVVRR